MQKIHSTTYKLKYSQNFLRNPATIERLVNLMEFQPGDIVIEIGPGTGQLTRSVLPRLHTLIAVEKDANLSRKLVQKYNKSQNLICVNADFLDYPLPLSKYKIIGNIPFAHTSEIMRKLVKHQSPPIVSYLIMQYEAAQKLAGEPQENMQSLLLKPQFDIEILTKIPNTEFVPIPQVNAALISIQHKLILIMDVAEYERYANFITNCFTGYYPHTFAMLKKRYSYHTAKFIQKSLGINLHVARGEVKFEQWLQIWQLIDANKSK